MASELPLKNAARYTDQINVRVEPDLKEQCRALDGFGVDVSEFLRRKIREALGEALERYKPKVS